MIDCSKMTHKQHMRNKKGKSKKWCYVYILQEISSGKIRYVGQTQINPRRRLRFHFMSKNKSNSPLSCWLRECTDIITIKVIDMNGKWDISEAIWIDRFLAEGHQLLNVNSVMSDRKSN